MNVLFHLSLLATIIFLSVGIYGLKLNKGSTINRTFFICCLSTALWSFGTGLTYVTTGNLNEVFFAISAFGWCYESALFLNIALLLTENKLIKNKIILFLLYVPGTVFYYLSIFVIRPNKIESGFINNFFYYGDSIYDITFSFISLFLIFMWTLKAKKRSQKIQGRIILITGFITYILNNLNQGILPLIGYKTIPPVAHLTNLILIIGLYYAIFRYKFLSMPESLVLDEIMSEMFDVVIIVSETGKILNVNRSTYDLTGYSQNEIEGKSLDLLIRDKDFLSFIAKNENSNETRRYKKICIKPKEGEIIPLEISCRYVMDFENEEKAGVIILGHDIRETIMLQEEINHHRKLEEKLSFLAYHDALTGLPDRKFMCEMAKKAIENGEAFGLLYLDIDNFKLINDNCGHDVGDKVLCEVAKKVNNIIAGKSFMARVGGDEFIIILFDSDLKNEVSALNAISIKDKVSNKVKYIDEILQEPILIGEMEFKVDVSVGSSIYQMNHKDVNTLIREADRNMYKVKNKNKENNNLN